MPISYADMAAALSLSRQELEPWEVETLLLMDAAYCSTLRGEIRSDMERNREKPEANKR